MRKYCGNSWYSWSQNHFSNILCSQRHWIWVMRNGNWYLDQYLTMKNTKGYMGQKYLFSTIREENIVAILHIYGARYILYSFVITKILNMSNEKYKLAYLNQYLSMKIYQRVYGTTISILYRMGGKYCGNYSYLWRQSCFPTILWSPRHWIYIYIYILTWPMWPQSMPPIGWWGSNQEQRLNGK